MYKLILFLFMVSTLCFIVIGVLTLIYLSKIVSVQNHLKREHVKVWTELGSPHLIWNNGILSGRRFLRVMKNGDLKALNDSKLDQLVADVLLIKKVLFILYVVMIAAFSYASYRAP
ncbi:hypothetical protein [Pseudaeromonas pectinilytica]